MNFLKEERISAVETCSTQEIFELVMIHFVLMSKITGFNITVTTLKIVKDYKKIGYLVLSSNTAFPSLTIPLQ
jgi:hypothetical protein